MSTSRTASLLPALLLMAVPAVVVAQHGADLAFRNGSVYTVIPARSRATAVAVRDGRISYVGDDAGLGKFIDADTRIIDLDGRMLLPGFHDSHIHLMSGGTWSQRCRLGGLSWPDAVTAALRRCAAVLQDGEWLHGIGLTRDAFAGRGPHRSLLDEIAGNRPAYVRTRAGDLAWVNSRTLQLARINADTPDPARGHIERDVQSGVPRGTLRGTAVYPAYRLIPEPGVADYRAALREASATANRFGITSINEARVTPRMLDAFALAEQAGDLTVRVVASLAIDDGSGAEQVANLVRLAATVSGERVSAQAAKIFVDGNLSQGTAALLEPYAGTVEDYGNARFGVTALTELVTRLDAQRFQLHLHAVGDRAIRAGLDAIESAMQVNGPWDRRHQIAHLVLPDSADLPRFKMLGVAADLQALWAQPDAAIARSFTLLGSARAQRLLPLASFFKSGARVVAGSDWPSESMSPLVAIQVALTRRPVGGNGPTWLADERASLAEMLAAYTINGAWLARREALAGSIEVGKAADLIVLERDLFEVAKMEISQVRVLLTLLDGEPVYAQPESGY